MRGKPDQQRFEALLREHHGIVFGVAVMLWGIACWSSHGGGWRVATGLLLWLVLNGLLAVVLAALAFWLLRRFGRLRWLQDNFAGR